MGRNTPTLTEVVNVLADQLFNRDQALVELEEHYRNALLVNAGDVDVVSAFATQLRLRVASEECGAVLDYMASKNMVGITIDHTEDAINELLGEDRFIEPER